MNKRKSGFTLMEIMVVIIVIAVLASVAGPMIGSITDQGRASATKSKLSSLKSALLAYQGDVGRFPYSGTDAANSLAYCGANYLSSSSEDSNVLVCDSNSLTGWSTEKFLKHYKKNWKGPYMDSDVTDFMVDSWGNDIEYVRAGKNLYLRSYGPDGVPYNDGNVEKAFKDQTDEGSGCDDIVISVTRFKASATSYSPSTTPISNSGSSSDSSSSNSGSSSNP